MEAAPCLQSVALAESSPSHYFLLNQTYYAGITRDHVNFMFTGDAYRRYRLVLRRAARAARRPGFREA